jgi:glycosyltransferase involved in cell wall biosynthesis
VKIAVVTPMMKSGERGGAEALYEGLVGALRQAAHDVDQVEVLIDESTFDAILASYLTCFDLDLSAYDLVISTKAPTYMVRHPNHVSYLLHTIRVFYDMYAREYGEGTPEQRRQRALIHRLDREGLHPDRVRRHFANGHETFERLYDADPFWRTVGFRALHHPPSLEGFKSPREGEYVFLPSRLHRWKRVDLVIEAYKHLKADLALKICGTGEDEPLFRQLAAGDPRIEFLGKVSDQEVVDLYAGALVVPFVPVHEDYGLVTIEAFKSQKPVLTCTDSGEPKHFVKDFKTGFVVEPDPAAIAARLDYLAANPDHAAEMGRNGCASVAHINWESIVAALVPSEGSARTFSVPGGRGAERNRPSYKTLVLDMQPIDPPTGGGRIRLLGLYHGLGDALPTTYIGTYDWPGPGYRHHQLSDTLEEIDIPLSESHFAASAEWQERVGGKTTIDVSFPLLAHLSPDFVAGVKQAVDEADIVVFSHPWIYPLVKERLRARPQLVVYDSHNVEGLLRAMLLDDGALGTELVEQVVRVEHELCQAADLILACSHEDRELFHELYDVPFAKVLIAPNGTFAHATQPSTPVEREQLKATLGVSGRPLAIFLGTAYQPNLEAAEFIRHQLAPTLPEVTFAICGGVGTALANPETDCANVRITGLLDEAEKLAYLRAADLAINPMFSGSGTNIKMFEFMAAGLPTVTTPVGARGIVSGAEPAFLVCDGPVFADRIRHLLADPKLAQQVGNEGRRLVERAYSWERISQGLGTLLHRHRSRLDERRPFFSVIVPTYERHEKLWEVVECLSMQTCRDFEVVIVDQSAVPWEGADRFPTLDMLYLHTDIKGAIHARNTGAAYARGQVLAFTDDDCLPLPTWLERARQYFTNSNVVGLEGLISSEHRNDPNYRAVTNEGFEGQGFMTANLFLRRETFSAIDGFDYQFDNPHFREDTDLGWRALEHGEIPFGRDVRVYHPPHPRHVERESAMERARFFEKDPLLLRKHPERYRTLFLNEGHYLQTPGFWENFLRGAAKYGVEVDKIYLAELPSHLMHI